MITEAYIRDYFSQVVEEAFEIFGFEGDHLYALRNSFLTIKKMRPLGTAHQLTGQVCISTAYIGTDFYDRLHNTIRHEVAHLVTPINEKAHGKVWKRNAVLLRATPKATIPMPKEFHAKKPIQVWALLEDGEKVFIKAMLRRPSKYKKGTEWMYTVKGKQVKSWIIEENKG